MKITVSTPSGLTVTPSSSQRSTFQSVPNTNPTVVTVEDKNPALRLGTVVSNTACTLALVAQALYAAEQAYTEANNASNTADVVANTANASANTVLVGANGYSETRSLFFANTASVQVTVNDDSDGNAVIRLYSTGGSGNGGGGIQEIQTGTGLNGGTITLAGTISANIANATVQGVTLIIDSVNSSDTSNAASANAVSTAYALAANAITQNANVLFANVITSNTLEMNGVEQSTTVLTTTANGSQVIIDMFPASEFSTFKYLIQAKSVDSIQALELLCVQDGMNTYSTQYGSVYTNTLLGDFEIYVSNGYLILYITPNNPFNHMITLKVLRNSLIS